MENLPQNNQIDFIFGSDGHAGLSQHKAAEILGVTESKIALVLKNNLLPGSERAKHIAQHGVQGYVLVKLAGHFLRVPEVSSEVKQRCTKLLEEASLIGAQTFIDRMAGIVETSESLQATAPILSPIQERLNVIEKAMSLLDRLGGLDERTKLTFSDYVRNVLLENQLGRLLPSTDLEQTEWTISDRIIYLGYKPQPLGVLSSIGRVVAELYRQRHNGQQPPSRQQFVDGALRNVKSYTTRDLDLVDQAIHLKLGEQPRNGSHSAD